MLARSSVSLRRASAVVPALLALVAVGSWLAPMLPPAALDAQVDVFSDGGRWVAPPNADRERAAVVVATGEADAGLALDEPWPAPLPRCEWVPVTRAALLDAAPESVPSSLRTSVLFVAPKTSPPARRS